MTYVTPSEFLNKTPTTGPAKEIVNSCFNDVDRMHKVVQRCLEALEKQGKKVYAPKAPQDEVPVVTLHYLTKSGYQLLLNRGLDVKTPAGGFSLIPNDLYFNPDNRDLITQVTKALGVGKTHQSDWYIENINKPRVYNVTHIANSPVPPATLYRQGESIPREKDLIEAWNAHRDLISG